MDADGIESESIWDQFCIDLGPIRTRFGVALGSLWGRFGVGLGSVWGRSGLKGESVWGDFLHKFLANATSHLHKDNIDFKYFCNLSYILLKQIDILLSYKSTSFSKNGKSIALDS